MFCRAKLPFWTGRNCLVEQTCFVKRSKPFMSRKPVIFFGQDETALSSKPAVRGRNLSLFRAKFDFARATFHLHFETTTLFVNLPLPPLNPLLPLTCLPVFHLNIPVSFAT
jgi:hypothetical protein